LLKWQNKNCGCGGFFNFTNAMATSKSYPDQDTAPEQPNKAAESLSPYIARTETKGSAPLKKAEPARIAGLPASDQVWRFAQENALVPHVETAVRLVRELFKEIREIRLSHAPDPEIPGWESIVIDLVITGDLDALQDAYTHYTRAFINAVPNDARRKINLLLWIG
jgi:hypothetical protein